MKRALYVLAIAGALSWAIGSLVNSEIAYDNDRRELEWKRTLLSEIYTATDRMYECTSEIYARGGGGPICQDACAKYVVLRDKQLHPPDWAHYSSGVIDLPSKNICTDKRAK